MNFFWTTSVWFSSQPWRPPFVNNINTKITKKNYNEQKGNNEGNGLILYNGEDLAWWQNVLPNLCKVITWVVILMEIWKKKKKRKRGSFYLLCKYMCMWHLVHFSFYLDLFNMSCPTWNGDMWSDVALTHVVHPSSITFHSHHGIVASLYLQLP